MPVRTGILSAVTEVPVLSQAFLRSASTQYRRVPAHFKPCFPWVISQGVKNVNFGLDFASESPSFRRETKLSEITRHSLRAPMIDLLSSIKIIWYSTIHSTPRTRLTRKGGNWYWEVLQVEDRLTSRQSFWALSLYDAHNSPAYIFNNSAIQVSAIDWWPFVIVCGQIRTAHAERLLIPSFRSKLWHNR